MKHNFNRSMVSAIAVAIALTMVPSLSRSGFAATPTDVPATINPSYILGVGDELEITVFGYDEYTGSQTILPDGTIVLPIVGSVTAAGQTPDSLAALLSQQLNPVLVDPYVTVRLTTLRPVVVNVAGEVQRPGPIQLRSVTDNQQPSDLRNNETDMGQAPTVSSAIVEAGGVTSQANIREIVVRRARPNGEYSEETINLWDSIWSEEVPQDLVLQPGDSIFVPTLPEGEVVDRRLLARSSLAPLTVKVRVIGEVSNPGEFDISPDSTIASAVAIAGGPTDDATLSRVELVRLNEDGTISNQQIDLRDLNDVSQVQEGDVVLVPERGSSSFLRVLGDILSPIPGLNGLINLFENF